MTTNKRPNIPFLKRRKTARRRKVKLKKLNEVKKPYPFDFPLTPPLPHQPTPHGTPNCPSKKYNARAMTIRPLKATDYAPPFLRLLLLLLLLLDVLGVRIDPKKKENPNPNPTPTLNSFSLLCVVPLFAYSFINHRHSPYHLFSFFWFLFFFFFFFWFFWLFGFLACCSSNLFFFCNARYSC